MNKNVVKTEKGFYVENDDYVNKLHPEARMELELNLKQKNLFKNEKNK